MKPTAFVSGSSWGVLALTALVAAACSASPAERESALTSGAAAAAISALKVSRAPDRSAAVPLDGAWLSGPSFVTASVGADVSKVRFWLDDPNPSQPSGPPRRLESLAPYDLEGTAADGAANPLDGLALAPGSHTVSAQAVLRDGSAGPVVTSRFGAGLPTVMYSASADRAGPLKLDGASVSGPLYVFAGPDAALAQVDFWLDAPLSSPPTRTERLPPFDLAGTAAGGAAEPLDVGTLKPGAHLLRVRGTAPDGAQFPIITSTFTVKAPSGGNVPPGYRLVFSDEFDGSTLDLSKWETLVPGHLTSYGEEQECYQPEAVTVRDGVCTLRAWPANTACGAAKTWVSGALTARTSFKHGYFEARMRLPRGKGLWPAFWLTSYPTSWTSEWDILEVPFPDNRLYGFIHLWDKKGSATFLGGAAGPDSTWTTAEGAPNLYDQFVTYGLEWTATELRYNVNGVLTEHWRLDGASDVAMWLALNLAVGGPWPGSPDASTPRPAEMLIDYVRVYQ